MCGFSLHVEELVLFYAVVRNHGDRVQLGKQGVQRAVDDFRAVFICRI